MTLVPPTSIRPRRSPFGVAAVAALTVTLAACSSSSGRSSTVVSASSSASSAAATSAASTTVTTAKPSSSSAAASTAAPAPTTAAVAGPAPVDPAALLARAVATLRNGYDVDTNVSAGAQTTNVAGRVVGPNSQFTLTSGDATVEYLQIPPQTWVREPGDAWTQATNEAAPREALTSLAAPTKLAFMGAAADGQHLKLSYDGATLGSETPVDAEMVLEPNGGMTVTYAATTQGKALAVITRLAPTANPTPITPPE